MTSLSEVRSAKRRTAQTNRATDLLLRAQAATGVERQRLLDEVVVANIQVARSIAGRYRNRGIALEDLEQVACLALVRAAQRFDPERSDDFLTFAVPTISGEVKRYFRDHGWVVRPPRRVQEVQALLSKDERLSNGHPETVAETAERLDLSVEDVVRAKSANGCFTADSLDAPLGETGEPRGNLLADEDQFSEWDAVEARTMLHTLTRELSPRERLIVYLRFVEDRSQAEIGEEVGVSQMQISRLLNRILSRMRTRLSESPGEAIA